MIFFLLPIAATTIYLGGWRAGVRRRNVQSWDSLLARLQPDLSARALSDRSLWKEGLCATPEDVWQRLEGPRGLCAIYKNAGVMLEMADYAACNSSSVDRKLLTALVSDAMHIRVYVLIALGQYAFSQVNENICANAFHAASIYVEMAARTTQLLQDQASAIVPDFVAAM
jgi:uncharacterized membrane protein